MFQLYLAILSLFFLLSTFVESYNNIHPIPKNNLPYEVVTHLAYIDISIEKRPAKRLHIALFRNKMPKMVENFLNLCTGKKGTNKDGVRLHYKGTKINRIKRHSYIEGGDLMNTGENEKGVSSFGDHGEPFYADNYDLGHNDMGYVAMRIESNALTKHFTSFFYITTRKIDIYDNLHVVFGRLLYQEERIWLRNELRHIGTVSGYDNYPIGIEVVKLPLVEIVDSGELPITGEETAMLNPEHYKKSDL